MRVMACMLGVVALLAAPALADTYGWEDGVGTILGSYGNLVDDTNVTGPQDGLDGSVPGSPADFTCPGAHTGERYLHVAEQPHGGTPQAYLAFIENLTEGDVVTASFFGYDITPDVSPSLRIWAHYAYNGDVMSYAGSAGGNNEYTDGTGWDDVAWEWTIPAGKEALVIEARVYSYPSTDDTLRTDYFIDDVMVTAPEGATITFAPEPASLLLLGLGLLALRRR